MDILLLEFWGYAHGGAIIGAVVLSFFMYIADFFRK